ncbi:TlpA family protein disulfide reductase [Pollutimonas bauzanensis]|uniref:Tat (Twin-arginine translocation) pathway signal sequence n=1 Tax=Pollutimonas bauzanensis TaxID=658167 RepID=A0A1M5TTJ6_9BURK|nr:TlpA disulfide reductase family protein [Pollutimonas bauzanensis]SHH53998.1 Tat (twin-arginine translocation) pathway signal sequence [Pollutimonas bauzanensis]
MKRRDFLRQAALAGGAAACALLPLRWAQAGALPPDPFYANGFPDIDGREVELTRYLGKPLVLNFWATWCAPCVKEMPDLDMLHKKHGGVNFVGLAVDTLVNVEKFGKKVQVSYPLLIAGHGAIQSMRALGNKQGGLPFTVVFDGQGQVASRILGQVKPDELDALLNGMA